MAQQLFEYNYTLSDAELMLPSLWKVLSAWPVIAFSGDMGAGKTTFIHKLCDMLKVQDTVSSPTFALINEYHFDNNGRDTIIYHMDWYRVKSVEELLVAGIEDTMLQAIRNNDHCFIEWPEKAPSLLPAPHIWITIDTIDEYTRHMTGELR